MINSESIHNHDQGYWSIGLFGEIFTWIDNLGYILCVSSVSCEYQSCSVRYKKIVFPHAVAMIIYNARIGCSVQGWINKRKNSNNVEIAGK